MILVLTHKEDFTVDFIVNILNERKIHYYRLNFEDLEIKHYNIQSEKNFVPIIDSCDTVDSVWFRRTKLPNIKIDDPYERKYILAEYDSLLSNIYFK